eukprot:COSAG02_NODE_5745_length_4072_cov_9.799899_7_plen_192_part_00
MTAHPSRVTETPSLVRRPWSAATSTTHEWTGAGDASLSGSQLIGLAGVSDGDLDGSEARSVLLTDPQLASLPSRLAEISSRRPGSARVVTPLRRHVDTLIEHEAGLPPQETPEEYAERLEKERKEEEELLRLLKDEEEEALREKARKAEEEDAIQRFAHKLLSRAWLKANFSSLVFLHRSFHSALRFLFQS